MRTDLLVIGAGPYAYAAAAYAEHRGIRTHMVGRPMSFWREHMPDEMFLRSGPDWHLDATGEDTFAAFFEDRGLDPAAHDPIPIGVFLDHTDWFAARKGLVADQRLVTTLTAEDTFTATLDDGDVVAADRVLVCPGNRYFAHLPDWAEQLPDKRRSHTSDRVTFDDLAGARVAIIGGRQSAYEWAALLCDHGAARVDVVHRHDTPAFEKVSWRFVDAYVEATLAERGWWRGLSPTEQRGIAEEFWQVGRLTLEPWLVPRIPPSVVTSHPGQAVARAGSTDDDVSLSLTNGEVLEVDHVVFASGYVADLTRVPYLAGVLDRISLTDGFPHLTEGFETSLPGLSLTGFASTRDFGPFYGFTKGCASAARLAVDEMLR